MGLFEKYFMKQYYDRPSRVAEYQKLFQVGSLPAFDFHLIDNVDIFEPNSV